MRVVTMEKTRDSICESVAPIDPSIIWSAIGHAEFYNLLYNRLNAKAYPTHSEGDFGLQFRSDGIATYIELTSKLTGNLLGWCIWDEDEQSSFRQG